MDIIIMLSQVNNEIMLDSEKTLGNVLGDTFTAVVKDFSVDLPIIGETHFNSVTVPFEPRFTDKTPKIYGLLDGTFFIYPRPVSGGEEGERELTLVFHWDGTKEYGKGLKLYPVYFDNAHVSWDDNLLNPLVRAFKIRDPWDMIKEVLGEVDGRTLFRLLRGKSFMKVRFKK